MPRTKLQAAITFPQVPDFIRPDLYGVTWGLNELGKIVKRDPAFISQEILIPNRRLLDYQYGGPVKFPSDDGSKSNKPYKIQARQMAYWIDQHWNEIQGGGF